MGGGEGGGGTGVCWALKTNNEKHQWQAKFSQGGPRFTRPRIPWLISIELWFRKHRLWLFGGLLNILQVFERACWGR